jgi:hypothetical protein
MQKKIYISIVACVYVAAGMYLPNRCLGTIGEAIHTDTDQGDLIFLILFYFQDGENCLKHLHLLTYTQEYKCDCLVPTETCSPLLPSNDCLTSFGC